MGRQYFNGIWHTGFLNLNTGAVETSSSYPNSIYSDLIFFPAGTYTIEGATITEWRLRVYNSDGTYRESISCNSAAVTLKTNIYARILLFHGLSNEQQQTFKIYRGGDEMVKASAQYTIAEIHEECNVVISNESHVFRADKNNTAIANNVTIQVYGYQGNTQVATTVGTISGKPSAGMTTTINNNGQTNTSITVAVTTALTSSIANNGVLTIPVTVVGKTFNKTFSWSKAQTGATGSAGAAGKGVSSTTVTYQVGTSGTTAPTGTWSLTVPSVSAGQYLWTRTIITYTDNTTSTSYSIGKMGETGTAGKGISSTAITYQVSSNGTTVPTGDWVTSIPSVSAGQYLWTRTIITYTDNTTSTSYSVGRNGTNGTTARTYWVTSSANTVTRSMKGTLTPATITFGAYYRDGTSATSTAYSGRFIIQESSNGTSWTTKYTSSANESSKVYTPTKTTNLVKCTMYAAGVTTNALDTLTIGIVDSIDDLQIGARNYARDSLKEFTQALNGTANSTNLIACEPGEQWAISFDIKGESEYTGNTGLIEFFPTVEGGNRTSYQWITGTVKTEYSRLVGYCTVPANCYGIRLGYRSSDGVVNTYKKVKIEKGNQATDWTPAPEDTDDRITQVEGDLTGKYNDLVNNDIAAINDKLAQEIADTKTMKEDLGVVSQQATTLVSLVDENEKKTQALTQTVSNMLLSGESLDISFDRTKGVNLLKNSVMQQHKTAVASGVIKADFWLNKNLEEDYFSNVYYNEEALVRKATVCGNSFQIRTKTTDEVKYDFILSSPIDLKENVENLLLAYKIKGNISAGNCFVGLVFYKHLIDQPNGLSFTSSSSNPYITNAYYVPINCYAAAEGTNIKKINASFTQDYIYKTMPLATPEAHVTKEVNETLVAEEGQIELTYLPQTGSNIVLVSPSGVQGVVSASDSRLVTLPAALLEETIVTATYNRSIETFKTATSTTDAQTKTNSMPDAETTICYNSSSNKIYVYNPFTKSYYLSNNLYDNTSNSSNIDTVRVIIGICGATISSNFVGNVEIADLKLEYDSTSVYWTQNLDESYSKKYRMDEKGFSISSDQNMMFIDENQIAAYQLEETTTVEGETIKEPDLDNPVFQISGAETQLQKTIIYDELKISNRTKSEDGAFVFKQLQTESGDWYFLFY